jgi:hypothetical protein
VPEKSKMPVIKFWRDGAIRDGPPGIEIFAQHDSWAEYLDDNDTPPELRLEGNLQDMYNFAAYTSTCLNYLMRTAVGRTILPVLSNGSVSINYSSLGNQVASRDGEASLNLVAREIYSTGKPGPVTRQVAARMNIFRFMGEFRRQPKWDLLTNPGANFPGDLRIDDDSLHAWIVEGRIPMGLGHLQLEQLKLSTISTLDSYSPRGRGSGSNINFCNRKSFDLNNRRPPAIGLAHELIHAYYSFLGLQCGRDLDYTTPLFEFKCVGLGRPWSDLSVSENSVRAQWGTVVVPLADIMNHPDL